jgi:short subunit dehydrogenase-like uncharacterized protein
LPVRLSDISGSERRFDIILFGASGFTGRLTAEYLADRTPPGTRWALAGRDRDKLERVRAELARRHPRWAELPLLYADALEPESIGLLAGATRVMISTVGPYVLNGEPIVAACADAGTDYVDLSGEQEFVDRMYLGYHERALATGARLVHCCGFEAIAYDLGVLFTVKQLPDGVPIELRAFLRLGVPRSSSPLENFSSGSLSSALTMASRRRERLAAGAARRATERPPAVARARAKRPLPRYERASGSWLLPIATVSSSTVTRSAAALAYGLDFSHQEYLAVRRPSSAILLAAQAGGLQLLAWLPRTRSALLERMQPGRGPSMPALRRRSFRLELAGHGGGTRVSTEVSGGDPSYLESSKMLAESALCLAHDEIDPRAGQLTPAVAMGEALLGRLQGAGLRFRVVSLTHSPRGGGHTDMTGLECAHVRGE